MTDSKAVAIAMQYLRMGFPGIVHKPAIRNVVFARGAFVDVRVSVRTVLLMLP
jgi:hypothetical protein